MIKQACAELKSTLELFSVVTNAMSGVTDSVEHATLHAIVCISDLTNVPVSEMTTCLQLSPMILLTNITNEQSTRQLTDTLRKAMAHDKECFDAAVEKSKSMAKNSLTLGLLANTNPEVQNLMRQLT